MKINNISPSINFGKVIAINKGSNVERHHQATLSKCATILNGGQAEKGEKFYTKEEKEEIKEFFKDVFEKDNKKIRFKHFWFPFDEENYLVSGQESEDIITLFNYAYKVQGMELPETKTYKNFGGASNPYGALKYFKEEIAKYAVEKSSAICLSHVNNQERYHDSISLNIKSAKQGTIIEKTKKYQDGRTETSSIHLRTYYG